MKLAKNSRENVGFIQFASSPVHFAGLLEIARDQFLDGNSIHFAIWGAQTHFPCRMSVNFQSLSRNIPKNIVGALNTAAPSCEISNELRFDQTWVTEKISQITPTLMRLKSVEDFTQLRMGNLNPGPAIANEFVTITKSRNSSPVENLNLISDLLQSYLETYSATELWIREKCIDQLFLFNGRFLHERAAWDAGKVSEISILIFETTRNNLHVRQEGFHNRVNNQRLMLEHWDKATASELEKFNVSDQWFANLRSDKNPFSTGDIKIIDIKKPYILYFSNSDDEAVGFWEHWSQNLGTQLNCVKELIRIIDAQSEYSLVIRLHPNLASKPKRDQQEWLEISSSEKVTIFGPNDPISSYLLIQSSQAVITFGSTIGIEAAYMGKPVMVLADCKYDELGFAFKPTNWDTAQDWIENSKYISETEFLEKRNLSRIFGYFIFTGGQRFKHSNLEEAGWGAWKVIDFLGFSWKDPEIVALYRKFLLKFRSWRISRNMKK